MEALSDIRVLDLAGDKAAYCSKLLSDLGAEVILLEPPSGCAARKHGPFLKHNPHPDYSIGFLYYNINKKSITLNVHERDGMDILMKLIRHVDVVINSYSPGESAEIGIHYDALSHAKPELIVASITGYGLTGPKKNYAYSELTAQAAGGLAFVTGQANEPPVRLSCDAGHLQASLSAAVGILIALLERDRSHRGQLIDISTQEAVAEVLEAIPYDYYFNDKVTRRRGSKVGLARGIFECKDGHVACNAPRNALDALLAWMCQQGDVENAMMEKLRTNKEENADLINGLLKSFFKRYTKEQLYHEAQDRRIPLCPVNTISDVIKDQQLREREYYRRIDHPGCAETLLYAANPMLFDGERCFSKGRAPSIGEHNVDVYTRLLGIPPEEIEILMAQGVV